MGISIHVPHVGRDGCKGGATRFGFVFQSTCPMWGATNSDAKKAPTSEISIHVPHVGRDSALPAVPSSIRPFQSTCPMWGATKVEPL